jgi:hypothetical protein
MRARRALAILIATPVLLATVGMADASAVAMQKSTPEGSSARPKPTAEDESRNGEVKRSTDEEMEPEEGLLGTVGGELLDRVSSRRA